MKYKGLKKKKTEEYYEQFYSTFAETIRKEVEHFYHDMPKYQRLQCYWLLVSEGKLSYRSKKNGVEAGVCVLVEYMFSKGDVYFNALDMATSHLIRQSDIKKLETFSRYVDVFIRRPDFTMLDNEESKAYIPEVILQKWKGGLPAYLDWSRRYQADLAKRAGDPTLIPDARVISKPEKRSLWKKAKVVYDLKKKRYGLQKVLALIPGKGGTYILASGEDKRKFCQLIWIGDDNKARELTRLEVEIPESRIPYLNCRLAPDGGYIMVHYTKGPVYALNANPKATRFGRRAYGLPRLAATTACPGNDVIYFISDDKLWAWYFITKKESVLSSRPPLVKFHAQPLHQLNVKSMTFDAQKDRLLALGEVAVGQRQNIPAEPKGLWSFNLVTHEWAQLLENGYGITDGVITTGSDNRIRVGTKTFLGYFDTKNDSLSLQFSLGSWGPKLPRGFIVEPVNKAAVNLKRSHFPAKPLRGRVNEFHWIDANGVFWEFNDEISCISVKDGNEYIAPLTGRKEKIILLAPGPTDKTLVMATEHRVWKLLMPDLSR